VFGVVLKKCPPFRLSPYSRCAPVYKPVNEVTEFREAPNMTTALVNFLFFYFFNPFY
jgi:hypothetical protein